jgi:TPP-dependent pyruvate/acetoin dehydrogenase alpha subunit
VWSALRADIEDAIAFAEASPLPAPDQILADVYTERTEAVL